MHRQGLVIHQDRKMGEIKGHRYLLEQHR
jgi:hypothetical protein